MGNARAGVGARARTHMVDRRSGDIRDLFGHFILLVSGLLEIY